MEGWICCSWCLAILSGAGGAVYAAAQSQAPQENAAEILREAFAVLESVNPEFTGVVDADGILLDPRVPDWLDQMKPAFVHLHRAASLPTADWGLDFSQGLDVELPHASQMLRLMRMAVQEARRQLPNDAQAYVSTLMDALAAGFHVGADGSTLGLLVTSATEKTILGAISADIRSLDQAALDLLQRRRQQLPNQIDIEQIFRYEVEFYRSWMDRLRGEIVAAARLKMEEGASVGVEEEIADQIIPISSGGKLANDLRMASMVVAEGRPIRIGLEYRGGSLLLSPGDTDEGIELISANFESGQAVVARGGEMALIHLRSREIVPLELAVAWKELAELWYGEEEAEKVLAYAQQTGLSLLAVFDEAEADTRQHFGLHGLSIEEAVTRKAELVSGPGALVNPLSRSQMRTGKRILENMLRDELFGDLFELALQAARDGVPVKEAAEFAGIAYEESESGLMLRADDPFGGKPIQLRVGR